MDNFVNVRRYTAVVFCVADSGIFAGVYAEPCGSSSGSEGSFAQTFEKNFEQI